MVPVYMPGGAVLGGVRLKSRLMTALSMPDVSDVTKIGCGKLGRNP
jgi:hypothetical protein